MKTYNTMENILAEWGKERQTLPANNTTLKNQLLDKLSSSLSLSEAPTNTKRLPWLSLALGSLAVITFVLSLQARIKSPLNTAQRNFQCGSQSGLQCSESNALSGLNKTVDNFWPNSPAADYYSPPATSETPITDNREFLKTNYTATIKSRQVPELTNRLQTIIRGFEGRVDNSTSSEKSGYVSFVVPANKFESFKNEIKDIVGARFFFETVQSQNLLSQKRAIEQQQNDAQTSLAKLKTDRDALIANHNNAVSSFQVQINSAANQLAGLNRQPYSPENENQKRVLQNRIASLKLQLSQENSNFTTNLNSLDAQIQTAESNLKKLDNQNTALLDNVATVQGTISISHLSVWQLINLYLPAHWLPISLVLAAIAAYLFHPRRMAWS
jgi:hypothetical protein